MTGLERIHAERRRVIEKEGFTSQTDRLYKTEVCTLRNSTSNQQIDMNNSIPALSGPDRAALFRSFHGYFPRLKITAVLRFYKAYLDESYDQQKRKAFAVAGWLGPQDAWSGFIVKWSAALASRGLDSYHMTDCECGYGDFARLTKLQRDELTAELIGYIREADIQGFGSAVDMKAFHNVRTAHEGWLPKKYRDPYFIAFQYCIQEMCLSVNPLPPVETIAFVFDSNEAVEGNALAMLSKIESDPDVAYSARIGSAVFASRKEQIPLQAADIIARETMKLLLNWVDRPELPERNSLKAIKGKFHPTCTELFTEPALRFLFDHIDAKRPK